MTRLRTISRGLTSLVALAAIVGGLPVLLARWGTLPGSPSKQWWTHLGDSAASDTTVFTVLTVAAWIAWAIFTATVTIELVAGLRGVQAPRVAIAGPLQRSARTLVAGVLLLLSLAHTPASYAAPLPAGAVSAAPPMRVAVVAELTQFHTLDVPTAPTPDPSADPVVADEAVVTVERGDNPWRLAETHLGDGMRWRELYELNCGVPQPDGRAWTDPELILPGWQLRLPTATTGPTAPLVPVGTVHVVVAGDTLSSIAEQYLGDADRYPEVFDANRDTVQPDGRRLTDPNLIVVGWTIHIPTTAIPTTTATPPSAAPPETTTPAPTNAEAPPATTPPPVTTTAASASTTTTAPTTTPTAAPAATSPRPGATAASDNHSGLYAGIAGAVALATALALRFRWLHRRRATRGANLPPANPSHAERATLAAADVPLVRWAAQHIALLVRALDHRDATAAPIAVEFSDDSGLEVLWEQPQHALPFGTWTVADGGWAWRLAYDPDAPLPADDLPSGIPALVTIGQRDGRQLLVDLEAFGTLDLVGPTEHTTAFARSLALELASGTDLADAYVTTVGLDLDPQLAPRHRLIERSTADAIDAATNALGSVNSGLDHDGYADTFRARLGSATPIEATIVIAADPSTPVALPEPLPSRRGVAIVSTTTTAVDLPAGTARVVIAVDGKTATIEPLGIDFTPVGLHASSTDAITDAMHVLADLPTATDDRPDSPLSPLVDATTAPIDDGEGSTAVNVAAERVELNGHHVEPKPVTDDGAPSEPVTDAVDDPLDADPPAGAEPADELPIDPSGRLFELDEKAAVCAGAVEMLVRVLGVPSIPERPEIGRRELILAVMLACRGGSLAASTAQDALWGGKPVEPKTVWNLVTAARKALGDLPDGTPVMPAADRTHGTLRLSPAVRTDLDVLRHAVAEADNLPSSQAIAVLDAALQLIEGPPFDAPGYDWAHRDQDVTDAGRTIEAAVDRLVSLAADTGRHDIARDAIRRGLRGLPGDEHLYRTRMRLEARAGNMRGVAAAYDELIVYLQDIEAEPSPLTTALYNDLRTQTTKVTV